MPKGRRLTSRGTKKPRPARAGRSTSSEQARAAYDLGERVKELTALHETARLLHDQHLELPDLIARIAALLPPAFQFPEITAALLSYGDTRCVTAGYRESEWTLESPFRTRDGSTGLIRVIYTEKRPASAEGPFLAEERRLLDSLAEILRTALDRRLAESGLRQSQERLTLALSSAGMGVWQWDFASGRVVWSEELERIAGLEPGAFGGTLDAFRAMVHPDDIGVLQSNANAALSGDDSRPYQVEIRFRRADGEVRWLSSSGRVLRDASGVASGMLGMAHDVSALRALEQQLRQSQRMEAMGRLAGGVAHDFNNLLTAIKGYSEFVAEALEPGDQRRKDVEEITAAADRAAALTRQLLAFSRHQVLSPRVIDANTVVSGVEKLLKRLIGAPIRLAVALHPETVCIRVDPGQLEQVVINLAVNARDAMPGGGTLRIETSIAQFDEHVEMGSAELSRGRYAVIAVSDTGTGMTAETKSRLFEPFFTTKDPGHGTGLGLATVYGIVQQSGGSIVVFSELGAGATFKVFLPWVGEAVEPVASPSEPAGSLLGTERVLFVDDDEQVRALADRALRANGYHVIVCANGEDALRLVGRSGVVNLVVTDVVMPRMQGPELYARIHADQPRAKVLYITGFTENRIDDAHGPLVVLQKPFTPTGLLRSVRAVLDAD